MKNIIFLFNIIVYSVQIASLILTFFILLKFRNKTFKYYFFILLVTLLDNIANSLMQFLNLTIIPGKPVLIAINYFCSFLLTTWFFFSALLVHNITGKKISQTRLAFIVLISIYPVFYVLSDVLFYGILGFSPSTEFFSFCVISTLLIKGYYIFIFLYMTVILFLYRKNISDDRMGRIAFSGMIFSFLFIPAFLVDLSCKLNGFYFYSVLILVWNLMNILYLWKNIFSLPNGYYEKTAKDSTKDPKTPPIPGTMIKNNMLTVKDEESYIFLKFEDIITVKASNKKTQIKTANHLYTTDCTLGELERKSSGKLLRAHRNTLVNPAKVKKVEKYFSGTFAVIMENDEIVEMSRRVSSEFRKNFLNQH